MPKEPANPMPSEPVPGAGFQPAERLVIASVEQLKAISDPLRLNILELIGQVALTVKQMATRLDQPPTKLYYHVAELEKAGFVTLVDTRVKSGILEKYYRISAENITIDYNLLNAPGDQEGMVHELLSAIFDTTAQEVTRSIAAGLVNMEDVTSGQSSDLILLRSLFTLRRENVSKFIEKFTALLTEMDAEGEALRPKGDQLRPQGEALHPEGEQPGPDTVSYACTIAFYPRVSQEKAELE